MNLTYQDFFAHYDGSLKGLELLKSLDVSNKNELRKEIMEINSKNNDKENEKTYSDLKKYLNNRGLDFCELYNKIADIETRCIRKADKVYPKFGIQHENYSEKLMDLEMNKLKKRWKINDEKFQLFEVIGYEYCNPVSN